MAKETITNIDQLVSFLCELLQEEHEGTIDLKKAMEINNTAGKIINAAKVKIMYLEIQNSLENVTIPFLEESKQGSQNPRASRLSAAKI